MQGAQSVYQGANRGQPPDADFVEFDGVFEHNNVAILTITITADMGRNAAVASRLATPTATLGRARGRAPGREGRFGVRPAITAL